MLKNLTKLDDLMAEKMAANKFLATTTVNEEYCSQGMDKEDSNSVVL